MPKRYIDLHIHTNASDGLLSPEKVVEASVKRNLSAISITDHDTTDGFSRIIDLAKDNELELVPGVELSCMYLDTDVHLLGYYIDYNDPWFVKSIQIYRKERYLRGIAMVNKLNEIGINIKMETVNDIAGDATVGRPHLAEALLKEEFVQTFDEAFARYLGYHAPAYVPKKHLDVEEAINLIHHIGGVAVLAHPGTLRHDEFIPDFVDMELDGIEAYHSLQKRNIVEHYKKIARKYNIFYTGGSDCHGPRKGTLLIGNQRVPYSCLEKMKEAVGKR